MVTGIAVYGYGVMVGANNVKFYEKRRFGKLAVRDKKGKEAERREIRGGGESQHRLWFLPEGRFMMSIPVSTFCAIV